MTTSARTGESKWNGLRRTPFGQKRREASQTEPENVIDGDFAEHEATQPSGVEGLDDQTSASAPTAASSPDDPEAITDKQAAAYDWLRSHGAPPKIARSLVNEALPKRNGLRQSPMKRSPWGAARRETYQTEREFQAQVEELAGYLGWYCWHVNLPMRSKAGFPDLLLIRERVVWAELKVHRKGGRGKVMPEQRAFHDLLRAAGQEVHVWFNDDEDFEKLQAVLARVP